jgi:hypothetical protein
MLITIIIALTLIDDTKRATVVAKRDFSYPLRRFSRESKQPILRAKTDQHFD